MAEDGHSYERESIESWLASSLTSPKTNAQLQSARLMPNHALKSLILDFREKNPTIEN